MRPGTGRSYLSAAMSLRFILGRAGAGKTRWCLEEIRKELSRAPEGPALVLLVPEQATFQTDRALLESAGIEGTIRAQVLSFRRLALRILEEAGGAPVPAITEMGRRMLLRRILLDLAREGSLRAFRRSAARPRFVERLSAVLSELRRHGEGAAEIARRREAAERADGGGFLAAKLSDLGRIASRYDEAIRGRLLDGDAILDLAAARAGEARLLLGARVFVDGFAGFTPQEQALLGALLGRAASCDVTLCLDPDRLAGSAEEDEVFARPRAALAALRDLAGRAGIPLEAPQVLDRPGGVPARFSAFPALAAVEAVLAGRDPAAAAPGPGTVSLRVARSRRLEAEEAAREALRLRRRGFRWREIAVLARDLEPYADRLEAAFRARGIPLFLDIRRDATHHPLVELLRSAVEAAAAPRTGRPPETEAVLRAAKTGLLPLEELGCDAEADILENYVLAHGIEGPDWLDPGRWRGFRRRRLEEEAPSPAEAERRDRASRARGKLGPLFDLVAALGAPPGGAVPVGGACEAIERFLAASGALDRVRALAGAAARAGDPEAAEAHRQVHNRVLEVIAELKGALGGARLDPLDFLAVLEAGLEGIRLALVPQALDAVVAGEVERSRTPAVRALVVLGLSEGSFPATPAEDPMIPDDERAALASLPAAPVLETAADRLLHEPYLAYVALTRASERLVLLRPSEDEAGRPLFESSVWRGLANRLPARPEAKAEDPERAGPLAAADASDLVGIAARGGPGAARLRGILAAAPLDAALSRALEPASLRAAGGGLPREVLQSLFRPPISFGVTALETFAACPFQHFAKSILRLEPRPLARVQAPEVGTFLHGAVERVTNAFAARGEALADAPDARIEEALDEAIRDLAPRIQGGALERAARERALLARLRGILREGLLVLREHARRGRFRPWGSEVPFGERGAALPAVEVPLARGRALVRGRIDRLETAEAPGGGTLVRVIDFKSTARAIEGDLLLAGIQVQLFAYLLAARAAGERLGPAPVQPVGALYWPLLPKAEHVDEPPEDPRLAFRKAIRPSGLRPAEPGLLEAFDRTLRASDLFPKAVNKDGTVSARAHVLDEGERERLLGIVLDRLRAAAEGILAGETAPSPFRRRGGVRACTFCDFRAVCRFDLACGDRYRDLEPVPFERLRERLRATAGGSAS